MPTYKPRQVMRDLLKKGCIEIKNDGGSHQKIYNPKNNMTSNLPLHFGKDLKIGLVKKIYKQLGLILDY